MFSNKNVRDIENRKSLECINLNGEKSKVHFVKFAFKKDKISR